METPRSFITDEWIKKMWYTMEYCSAISNNEILLFADKVMKLENIMLSEISRAGLYNLLIRKFFKKKPGVLQKTLLEI
jgi:hypothetical protein